MSETLGYLAVVVGVTVLVVAIITPWIVASKRNHEYKWVILLGSLLFGWTVIGWFGMLIWAIEPWQKRTMTSRQRIM